MVEFAGLGVILPGREVPRRRPFGAFRERQAFRTHGRQQRFSGARRRKENLHVIVEPRAHEAGEVVTAQHQAHHRGRKPLRPAHLEPAHFHLVADPRDDAVDESHFGQWCV